MMPVFGVRGAFSDPGIEGLGRISIPLLRDVPVIGPLVSGHSWVVYASWALVVLVNLLLFRHRLGLRARGIGERPEAAVSLGVDVNLFRFVVVCISGALCGLAGAQLSLGQVTLFVENMTAGRGWIAVVAVMFGRAHPMGVFGAALLFGFFDALGLRLQGSRLPNQFAAMLPYVATLVGLFVHEAQRRGRLARSFRRHREAVGGRDTAAAG